jgi:hypothetical protein
LSSVLNSSLLAQLEPLVEITSELEEENNNLNEWIEDLQTNPLDLNNASNEALMNFPFFSKTEVETVLEHRPFRNRTQLRVLLGEHTYKKIRSFIVIKHTPSFPQLSLTQRIQIPFQSNLGTRRGKYLGNSMENLSRIRIKTTKNISAGFLIQKDPGELSYFDHYSAFLSWDIRHIPMKIILGNYYISCAEGLVLAAPFALPKSGLAGFKTKLTPLKVRPFLSSNEYSGFFGIVIQGELSNGFNFAVFYSKIGRDGMIEDDSREVYNLDSGGYHRTLTEISRINSLQEQTWGGFFYYPVFKSFLFGVSFIKTRYQPGFSALQFDDRRRNYFRFAGPENRLISTYHRFSFGNFLYTGEIVPVSSSSFAYKQSLELNLNQWGFKLLWNYFPTGFYSQYGQSLSASGPFPQSLQEYYFGLFGNPSKYILLNFYWYVSKDLWRGYFNQLPQTKRTLFCKTEIHPVSNFKLILRYQSTKSYDSILNSHKISIISTDRLRIQIEKKISTYVRFQGRVEKSIYGESLLNESKKGFSFSQTIYWSFLKYFYLNFQFSSFDTDDYNSRIYEYESGIPGVFSNYSLFGTGQKYSIMLRIRFKYGLRFWLKYREVNLADAEYIGSGLSRIEGNSQSHFQIQVDYKF